MSAPVLLMRQEVQESRDLLGFDLLLVCEQAAPCLAHSRCVITVYWVDTCSSWGNSEVAFGGAAVDEKRDATRG